MNYFYGSFLFLPFKNFSSKQKFVLLTVSALGAAYCVHLLKKYYSSLSRSNDEPKPPSDEPKPPSDNEQPLSNDKPKPLNKEDPKPPSNVEQPPSNEESKQPSNVEPKLPSNEESKQPSNEEPKQSSPNIKRKKNEDSDNEANIKIETVDEAKEGDKTSTNENSKKNEKPKPFYRQNEPNKCPHCLNDVIVDIGCNFVICQSVFCNGKKYFCKICWKRLAEADKSTHYPNGINSNSCANK
jgi:hypothetical protein